MSEQTQHETTEKRAEDAVNEGQQDDSTPQEAQEGASGATDPNNGPEEQGDEKSPADGSKEAAKYRTRLRETEAERDHVTEQRDSLRAALLQQILTTGIGIEHPAKNTPHDRQVRLRDAGDLFTIGGVDPSDLWGKDGALKRDKLREVVGNLYATRQELFAPNGLILPDQGKTPTRG